MPPPIPPFEPQVGIAPATRPPMHIPTTIYHSVHYESPIQCDLAVNTLPTEISTIAPYYYLTAYDKIAGKKPSYNGLESIEQNPTTYELPSGIISPTQTRTESAEPVPIAMYHDPYTVSADPYGIPIPITQLPAIAAETVAPYWEDDTAIQDWAYQQRIPQDWWNGPHLKHVPVCHLWPLIVLCILLLVVAAWLAVPGFPFRPF
jgi:hypothetical protein